MTGEVRLCGCKSTSSSANNPSQNNLNHQQLISERLRLNLERTRLTLALGQIRYTNISLIVLMGRIRGQPSLTTKQKACIAGMVEAGISHGRVARIVGSGQTTVSSIVSRARTCGTVETAEKSGLDRIAKY
ncbi:hypothetical protein PGT21_016273 [Puccinia graminis f. sp. tritici]|uniref:Uncharacterized protein n=1 Tax=Puccinia graminis f. sp. tritici TaxID=56615 RepID=A0A5B0M9T7_PUCGR|nr:hypothetical protein PGT21_016273 [Puccinia graminis f. sp. tritici]